MEEWRARIIGTLALIQSPTGALYARQMSYPDIYSVAMFIRNRPGVYRMAPIDPTTDTKRTRFYTEYRFITFPF